MHLQTVHTSRTPAMLGATAAAQQPSSQALQSGAGNEFASAMQAALGHIATRLQEAKTVLHATQQVQQPELTEVLQGFGVLIDQLTQAYGGAGGDGASAAPSVQSTASLAGGSAKDTDVAAAVGEPAAWERYFSAATYQRAEAEYVERVQQSNPTEQWVIAGLNKAIEQCKANGYDPEKNHTVNTLRGYFSGNAQARSQAIHSLDRSLLAAGGAYVTADYGLYTVAGEPPKGLNTNMPTFKSAFDKDWNRPSLYDMINSTVGWGEKANLLADPASRDAALNRKLSDEEILAFQAGSLTPELQALIAKYTAC